METFDLGVSFYCNKHGTPRGVKLKHLCKHHCFYCVALAVYMPIVHIITITTVTILLVHKFVNYHLIIIIVCYSMHYSC